MNSRNFGTCAVLFGLQGDDDGVSFFEFFFSMSRMNDVFDNSIDGVSLFFWPFQWMIYCLPRVHAL